MEDVKLHGDCKLCVYVSVTQPVLEAQSRGDAQNTSRFSQKPM